MLTISLNRDPVHRAAIVHITGCADMRTAGLLGDQLHGLPDVTPTRVVLDLTLARHLDFGTLSVIIAAARSARETGGWLRVVTGQEDHLDLLDDARLLEPVACFSSVVEALNFNDSTTGYPQTRPNPDLIELAHPSKAFDELALLTVEPPELAKLLSRITELTKMAITGSVETSITLINQDYACTAAGTSRRAIYLDERQYEYSRGPCLSAAIENTTIVVDDVRTDPRWPVYSKAVGSEIRSVLSVPLRTPAHPIGALNNYSDQPAAFNEASAALASTFAEYAVSALETVGVQVPKQPLGHGWTQIDRPQPAH